MNERQQGGRGADDRRDAWLRAAARVTLSASADGCPDADALAAFVEGRLDTSERGRLEQHVAGCARCVEWLAMVGRVTDEAAAPVAVGGGARSWWRWLVPGAVAATAAGVYLLVQPGPPGVPPQASDALAGRAAQATLADREPSKGAGQPAERPGLRDAQQQAATALPLEASPEAPQRTPATPAPVPVPSAPSVAARAKAEGPAVKQDVVVPEPSAAGQLLEGAAKRVAVADEARAQAASPAERELARVEPVRAVQAEARVGAEEMPLEASRPRAAAMERPALDAAAAHWFEASAPGGTMRWRFGPGTAVARSVDGGRTWEPGATPAGVMAAACPSVSTCWAVGRAGAVITTSDGVTWRRVAFPAAADLVAVTADTGSTATVTAASGARYTTADGGATWAAEPR